MYVEKKHPALLFVNTTEWVYIFRRVHRSLDEFGAARKLADLLSIGPPNDRGNKIRTILNKLTFLLEIQAVSGISY